MCARKTSRQLPLHADANITMSLGHGGYLIVFVALGLAGVSLLCWMQASKPSLVIPMLLAMAMLVGGLAILMCKRVRDHVSIFISAIFLCFFLLHVAYILYTPYDSRQHDSGTWDAGNGHAGYIYHLAESRRVVLDIDPRSQWSFYNSPLHYIIASYFVRLQWRLGMLDNTAVFENIQWLTLTYTTFSMLLGWAILAALNIAGRRLVVASAILFAQPIFTILSGNIGPDALLTLWIFAGILALIKWWNCPSLLSAFFFGLSCGLAIMTKISGAVLLMAGFLAFVAKIVMNLLSKKREWYISDALIVTLTSLPLGLWWNILMFRRYGMPIGYAQVLDSNAPQKIFGYMLWRRFFDFSGVKFTPFLKLGQDGQYDYNILLATIKTALFDEIHPLDQRHAVFIVGSMLFWVVVASIVLLLILDAIFFLRKIKSSDYNINICDGNRIQNVCGLILPICFVSICFFFMYIYYCLSQPFVATMNFRYIVSLLPLISYVFSARTFLHKTNFENIVSTIYLVFLSVFCFLSFLFFVALGI